MKGKHFGADDEEGGNPSTEEGEMDEVLPAPVEASKGSISRFLDDLQHADTEEARHRARNELWQRGWKLARSYARRTFLDRLDEDCIQDAANIAFEQFADAAREGKFPTLTCRKNFFQLLATFATRVAKNLRRDKGAKKHGGQTSFSPSSSLAGVSDPTADAEINVFEEAEEMAAFFQFLGRLGEDDKLFAIAELIHTGEVDPKDKETIAKRVGVTRATVFRKLQGLRAKWAEFESRVSSAAGAPRLE
jgi:RNA polymerase sigma factor (sigma-70 family)